MSNDTPAQADLALADAIIREVRMYGDDAREMIAWRLSSLRTEGETAGMHHAYDQLSSTAERTS